MKNYTRKAMVLMVGVIFIAMFITGCDEQDVTDTKKARLIAQENRQLKDQIAQLNSDIKRLDEELAECQTRNKVLESNTQEKMENMMGLMLESTGQESAKLRKENYELKQQLQKLQQ